MKKTLLTLLVLTSSLLALKAQTNLVLNPSFEIYTNCPVGQNELMYATGWSSFDLSPDYLNACSTNPQFSVPYNWCGYQQAASGVAYTDFCGYLSPYYGGGHNTREFIGGTLSSSLVIGTKYYVSFQVSLSLSDTIAANCAINNLGATFSKIPYTSSHHIPINNNPKIYNTSIIKDTANWTRIFGSFIADSTYKYIIIGNFFDDAHTDTLILDSSEYKNCEAYYYLDDVCVSTDSAYTMDYKDTIVFTGIEEPATKMSFNIFPNPANNYFNVKSYDNSEPYELIIYNVLGQELIRKENIQDKQTTIGIEGINDNLLFINIRTKNQNFNYKLLKL